MALTVLQWTIAFGVGLWWTERWLLHRPIAKWRHAIATLTGGILWVALAYTATNVQATSSGVVVQFGSEAMMWFSAFLAVVNFIGTVLGLTLWAEEELEQAGVIADNEVPNQS